MKKTRFAFLIIIFIFGCSAPLPEKVTHPFAITPADSLAPKPQYDYEVAYYIVGRIKTAKIESGIPVEIKIREIEWSLLGSEIAFKIVDAGHFKIFYTKDGKRIKSEGTFGDNCKQKDIEMVVIKTDEFDKQNLASLSSTNYMFSVSRK